VLSPPDGRLVQVHVEYDVTTACRRTFTASLSVSSDEALDPSDVVVVDEHTVQLRAARADGGDRRTYTIQIRAVDAEDLEATHTLTVAVPLESGPMTNVTLTTDRQSPQPLGTSMTLMAAGAGGTAPYA
jgi:threonine dehydrogenase-like Zn-dependent dehydrogenase